jgi:hypothetical protein
MFFRGVGIPPTKLYLHYILNKSHESWVKLYAKTHWGPRGHEIAKFERRFELSGWAYGEYSELVTLNSSTLAVIGLGR